MENNKKQTAVEWLALYIKGITSLNCDEVIEQAKEMEKEAHQETWDVAHQAGRFEGKGIAEENWFTFEEYWEENL
jgi:hypothetical protein